MNIYTDFIINDLVNLLPSIDKENNVVAVYLGGSMSRGDYIVGISDIDIYVVVNNIEKTNQINLSIQDIARHKLNELLSWCPDGVTVAFTTYNEVKEGKSWLGSNTEYYSFQETGKLLYGKDIKQEILKPTESDIIHTSQQAIMNLKQIVQQDVSNIKKDKYFIRCIFGAAFSAMFFYLCCNKIYIRGKEKIVFEFGNINPSQSETAKEILHLWNVYGQKQLTDSEIDKLINFTKVIMNDM